MADDNSSSARVLPKKKDFSWVGGGYQATGVRGLASLRRQYGGSGPTDDIPIGQTSPSGRPDNPNIVNPVAAPNPMFVGDMETQSALGIPPTATALPFTPPGGRIPFPGDSDFIGPVLRNPNTGGPASGQSDEEKTPEQRAADERRRWLADGGSIATMHRAEAKSGLRPRIDARSNAAAANSMAGAEIRQGWGWEPSVTSGSQGTAIAAQMTKDFTAPGSRSGDQNADWNKKFEDARSRLQASLKS